MKKSILIICFSFFFISSLLAETNEIKPIKEKVETEIASPCSVRITGTFNGVEVDLVVTVDASWLECTFFRRGVRKAVEEAIK